MRQVLYIDADEEMISVIGRLRKSTSSVNIIVAPHRSLILQSIVNLRLLNHDAHKNGKEIIVVTQDEQSRSLCEKAGIQTQAVLDGDIPHENMSQHMPVASPSFSPPSVLEEQQGGYQAASDHDTRSQSYLPFSDALGTADFFGRDAMVPSGHETPVSSETVFPLKESASKKPSSLESLSKPLYNDIKQVTVRDQNPKKLTTLNSRRFEDEQRVSQQKSFTPPSLRGVPPVRPVFLPSVSAATPASQPQPKPQFQSQQQQVVNPVSLRENPRGTHDISQSPWFSLHHKEVDRAPVPQKIPEKQVPVSAGGKMRAFFIFFSFVSVLSVVGVGAYLLVPKADIRVKLKVNTQKSDFEFNGTSDAEEYSVESRTIPVRLIEMEQDVSRSFDATGKTSLADQKARGSVIIYNEFSADPQTLVTSTRVLSKDGKVFRLLSGVTVPGMTTVNGKVEPGAIEAAVIADESGQEYNVAPTTFTIPGFEGSAKYTKFSATSTDAMSGGGASGSDAVSVSDTDIAKAKKTVEEEVKETVASIITPELQEGEKILSEATEISVLSSSSSPQSGAVTNTFDYRVKIRVRALVFSEEDLKRMISTLFNQRNTSKGLSVVPNDLELQYGEPSEDFTAKTLRINVHAVARFESSLDEAQLKSDLLGQDENSIAELLQKYAQIDSISIELWPEFLSSRVPTRASRVHVIVEPLESDSGK